MDDSLGLKARRAQVELVYVSLPWAHHTRCKIELRLRFEFRTSCSTFSTSSFSVSAAMKRVQIRMIATTAVRRDRRIPWWE